MHVVHLYDGHEQVYDGRGSVPGVVWNLARETAAAGHDVTVLERRWAGLAETATHDGVRFERVRVPTGADEPWDRVPHEQARSLGGLARLVGDRSVLAVAALGRLRRLGADVVHAHLPFAAAVLAAVRPGLRSRTVYTAHLGELRLDALTDAQKGDRTTVDAPGILSVASPDIYLANRAARTTVLNESVRQAFVARGVPRDRLTVLPNGVDVDRFGGADETDAAAVREAYDLRDLPTLLFVGTLLPRKGVTDLVEAGARLETRRVAHSGAASGDDGDADADGDAPANATGDPPWQLVVAGETDVDPDYSRQVRRRVAEHGLTDRVRLAGFVPDEDLPGLYALADLFVLPSREEGFGMTAVEAMAAGTPPVATRVGGLPDVIDDGDNGVLVEPGDVAGLAEAVSALLADPGRRTRMAERARQRAGEYRWATVADRLLGVYADVA